MEASELRKFGLIAYGHGWQRKVAEVIGVNERTVRRWVSGAVPMPSHVWRTMDDILALCASRIEQARKTLGVRR
jgi:DNA-binding transcriptional regulator YdaS (Cro superfamily)